MGLGWTEIIVIVGLALLFFGPSRLPGLGKSIGEAIRGFKKGIADQPDSHPTRDVNEHISHEDVKSQKESQKDKHHQS